jgi:hypothetical protein
MHGWRIEGEPVNFEQRRISFDFYSESNLTWEKENTQLKQKEEDNTDALGVENESR